MGHWLAMELSGARILIESLRDQGVDSVFGYPGGAVLPIYDELFRQNSIRHFLVRHEQGAIHAAEGYARATGKVGVVLVTSGPGVTNIVTGLTDALLDSIPVVCITGQVPTHLIGTDAFQECDTVGITRPCTKHNYLVRDVSKLAGTVQTAFRIAREGRPGPVVIDLPKDVQLTTTTYRQSPQNVEIISYAPQTIPDPKDMQACINLLAKAKAPIIYGGGGLINSGERACALLREFVDLTQIPTTLTLMGLGALPASHPLFLGMLGMHGTYEANHAMHQCDVMLNIGARFDDRVTGRLSGFSPNSQKIHIDIDPSSINKTILVDLPILGDCAHALEALIALWKQSPRKNYSEQIAPWWKQINAWRELDSLSFVQEGKSIKPQYAIKRLFERTKNLDAYISTEVGQHQMWAAQHYGFEQPRHWLTSGGLGTMGYGFPAAIGAQVAFPEALVIDIAGESSILMNMQEMSTAVQYRLPVKIFIINNEYMGMVRQWQELNHGGRYSESYAASLPDFVKLAQAYGAHGVRAQQCDELDDVIEEMITTKGPVIADIVVDKLENCFPMIPAGANHNEMILSADAAANDASAAHSVMV